eukprot:GHVU01148745.1.p1 GENE.GHVU01148745.1~~GHVU01148745.1.p1  ORF type:complete len:728 (-),score=90.55 GHVU01148745.1:56-2239(-)
MEWLEEATRLIAPYGNLDDEKISYLKRFLKGEARRWYNRGVMDRKFGSFHLFRKEFRKRFLIPKEAQKYDLLKIRQEEGETIVQFADAVADHAARIRVRLQAGKRDVRTQAFVAGLSNSLIKTQLSIPARQCSLQEALELAEELEVLIFDTRQTADGIGIITPGATLTAQAEGKVSSRKEKKRITEEESWGGYNRLSEGRFSTIPARTYNRNKEKKVVPKGRRDGGPESDEEKKDAREPRKYTKGRYDNDNGERKRTPKEWDKPRSPPDTRQEKPKEPENRYRSGEGYQGKGRKYEDYKGYPEKKEGQGQDGKPREKFYRNPKDGKGEAPADKAKGVPRQNKIRFEDESPETEVELSEENGEETEEPTEVESATEDSEDQDGSLCRKNCPGILGNFQEAVEVKAFLGDKLVECSVLLDTGASASTISRFVVNKMEEAGDYMKIKKLEKPVQFSMAAGDHRAKAEFTIMTDLHVVIKSKRSFLHLENVEFFILEEQTPHVFLGIPILVSLGVNPVKALEDLLEKANVRSLKAVEQGPSEVATRWMKEAFLDTEAVKVSAPMIASIRGVIYDSSVPDGSPVEDTVTEVEENGGVIELRDQEGNREPNNAESSRQESSGILETLQEAVTLKGFLGDQLVGCSVLLDTGASVSTISRFVVNQMAESGDEAEIKRLDRPVMLAMAAGSHRVKAEFTISTDLHLAIKSKRSFLHLKNVELFLIEDQSPHVILG